MVVLPLGVFKMDGVESVVTYMMIENRDATTHRGIAVGDSMRKVLNVYGRPVQQTLIIDGFMGNIAIVRI